MIDVVVDVIEKIHTQFIFCYTYEMIINRGCLIYFTEVVVGIELYLIKRGCIWSFKMTRLWGYGGRVYPVVFHKLVKGSYTR